MKRIKNFYKDSIYLGLNKSILFISIILYFLSVFFEAIGLFLIVPLVSLFLSGKGLESIIGSQEIIQKILGIVERIGFTPDKMSITILLIVIILCRQTIVFGRSYWNAIIQARLIFKLRRKALKLFLATKEDLFDEVSSGETVNDITIEVDRGAQIIVTGIEIIGLILMFLIYFILMLLLSWQLTIFAITAFFISMLMLKKLWNKSSLVGLVITDNNRKFMTHMNQRFANLKLLKLTGDQKHESNLVKGIIREQREKQFKAGFLKSLANSCIEPIIFLTGAIILFTAIDLLNLSIVNLGLFSLIMIRGVPIVKNFFSAWQGVESEWAALKAIIKTLDRLENFKEIDNGKKLLSSKAPSIKFKEVEFSYNRYSKKVLNSISFEINSEQIVAIVGPSGAGKSTLIDLIPRLKIANKGEVFLNNINIKKFDLLNLRKNIGYLPQTPQILEASLAEHVRYGNTGLSDQEIIDALEKAGCKDFLSRINYDLNTRLGAEGAMLSGGEKQRIDLARVLARKAPLLILDEPSSNLDTITEQIINEAIINELKLRSISVIVIGHRLRWFKKYDKVIVIKDGKVETLGTHNQVIKSSSWYKRAWKEQTKINEPR